MKLYNVFYKLFDQWFNTNIWAYSADVAEMVLYKQFEDLGIDPVYISSISMSVTTKGSD